MNRIGLIASVVLTAAAVLTGCVNSRPDNSDAIEVIAEKVTDGDPVSQEEYGIAIKYMKSAYLDFDKLRSHQNEGAKEMMKLSQEYDEKYPHLEEMRKLLDVEPADLDDANRKLYKDMKEVRARVMENGLRQMEQ
jgi:lipoprotein